MHYVKGMKIGLQIITAYINIFFHFLTTQLDMYTSNKNVQLDNNVHNNSGGMSREQIPEDVFKL